MVVSRQFCQDLSLVFVSVPKYLGLELSINLKDTGREQLVIRSLDIQVEGNSRYFENIYYLLRFRDKVRVSGLLPALIA